eukprot:m.181520 g.181520  ORF g.181520 m.181520 type:complete len:1103 (-) comp18039_c2_seq4:67-3375(-)
MSRLNADSFSLLNNFCADKDEGDATDKPSALTSSLSHLESSSSRRDGAKPRSGPSSPRTPKVVRTTMLRFKTVGGKQVPMQLMGPLKAVVAAPVERTADQQPRPRWPRDIELIYPAPKFVQWSPSTPQPFWPRPEDEAQLHKVDARSRGKVVYAQTIGGSTWFRKDKARRQNPDEPTPPPLYQPESNTDETLVFESRFESANLLRAVQVGPYEYNLTLRTDLYTTRHTQWFYFSVSNTRANKPYRFNIINLLKKDSLYNYGMQPVVYSQRAEQEDGTGWTRAGSDVSYYKNELRVSTESGERYYYTLSWAHTFKYSRDKVFFAHCYPYTYTDLQDYLTELSQDPKRSAVCRQRVMCQTLAGNVCDLLTVTEFGVPPAQMAARRGIVVTARVHPGETNSSWMMKGFLDFITGDHPDAQVLRKEFVFKIVPMLNPDGVIVGNYRCSLAGVDLNRTYKMTSQELFPTVFALKQMMQRLARDRSIVVYCDLHGHSRKQNVFVYGCENAHDPKRFLRERVFPRILALNGPDRFSFKSSRFAVRKAKEATGRVASWRELRLINSLTMEATFCGSTIGDRKGTQFSAVDFESMGELLCDSLLDYCDPDQSKCRYALAKLRQELCDRLGMSSSAASNVELCDMSASDIESESAGSDSSSTGGETAALQIELLTLQKSKDDTAITRRLKTRRSRNELRQAAVAKKSGKKKARGSARRAKGGSKEEGSTNSSLGSGKAGTSKGGGDSDDDVQEASGEDDDDNGDGKSNTAAVSARSRRGRSSTQRVVTAADPQPVQRVPSASVVSASGVGQELSIGQPRAERDAAPDFTAQRSPDRRRPRRPRPKPEPVKSRYKEGLHLANGIPQATQERAEERARRAAQEQAVREMALVKATEICFGGSQPPLRQMPVRPPRSLRQRPMPLGATPQDIAGMLTRPGRERHRRGVNLSDSESDVDLSRHTGTLIVVDEPSKGQEFNPPILPPVESQLTRDRARDREQDRARQRERGAAFSSATAQSRSSDLIRSTMSLLPGNDLGVGIWSSEGTEDNDQSDTSVSSPTLVRAQRMVRRNVAVAGVLASAPLSNLNPLPARSRSGRRSSSLSPRHRRPSHPMI